MNKVAGHTNEKPRVRGLSLNKDNYRHYYEVRYNGKKLMAIVDCDKRITSKSDQQVDYLNRLEYQISKLILMMKRESEWKR